MGSLFQDSNLPFSKLAGLIWCWSQGMSNHKTEQFIGVAHRHVVNWFRVRNHRGFIFSISTPLSEFIAIMIDKNLINFEYCCFKSYSSLKMVHYSIIWALFITLKLETWLISESIQSIILTHCFTIGDFTKMWITVCSHWFVYFDSYWSLNLHIVPPCPFRNSVALQRGG